MIANVTHQELKRKCLKILNARLVASADFSTMTKEQLNALWLVLDHLEKSRDRYESKCKHFVKIT